MFMEKQNRLKQSTILLIVLALLLSISACSSSPKTDEPVVNEEQTETSGVDDGKPWIDYDLRENIALLKEKPADPKDDLHLYVNYD